MKRLLAVVVAAAAVVGLSGCSSAWAGEVLLGVVVVTDAGTGTNFTAGAPAATPTTFIQGNKSSTLAGCVTGFPIPTGSAGKITIQTDEGCLVITDAAGCDAGNCIALTAGQIFPTSVNTDKTLTGYAWNWDGGAATQAAACVVRTTGGWVAVAPPVGGAACHARIYLRNDKE